MSQVVAVIVTHQRSAELARLLDGLQASQVPLRGCVIADHAPDGETAQLIAGRTWEILVLDDPANPGPGAGWAKAARKALAHFEDLEAIWYLDDDVVAAPETLGILLEEMNRAGAQAIAPLLEDGQGLLWAFPEPAAPSLRKIIRQASTPSIARQMLGDQPVPFLWCTGACLLVTKAAVALAGFHRADFWLLGEDLEYSMRLASQTRAVFTCKVTVPHLPPPAKSPEAARRADYVKFCSLLQNLSYLAFHSANSHHMNRYLPGNFRRFFRTHAVTAGTIRDAAACFLNGALRGQPAGSASGRLLRKRISGHA